MKHGTRKKKLKQRLMRPLAGLLAAGLLLCGGGAALAAANFDLGNNGTPINIGAGPYGDMVMYGATAANPHVEVASSLTTAFQNLIIQGGGGNGIYAGIESTVGALTFAGNATITAGSGNNEWASFQTNTNITFTTGTVTVTGNMLNGAVFAVTNGATVTAGGGFQAGTGGNINLGSTGIGSGTLVGNVTLAGASGDPGRLKVGDDASKVIGNVTVGIIGGGEGSLQLFDGDESAPVFKSFTITGNLVLNNLQRGAAVTLPGSPSQTVIVGAGTTLTVEGSTTINNDSILDVRGMLNSTGDVTISNSGSVLNIAAGGTVNAPNVYVQQGVLNVGPGSSPANITTGTVTVMNGGTVNIGAPDAAGKLAVTGTVDFQAGSTLSLFAAPSALTANGGIDVADGSKLVITGGQAGTINDLFGATALTHASADTWTGANLTSSSLALGASAVWNGNQYVLTVSSKNVPFINPSLNNLISGMSLDTQSPNTGVMFISRALDAGFIGANDPKLAAATVEGASAMAQISSVPAAAVDAANAGAGAVTGRTSFVHPFTGGGGKAVALHQNQDGTVVTGMSAGNGFTRNGLGLWLMPLYQNSNVWGMKAGSFKTGYNSSLGGLALGADYTFQEMFRVGAAFNVGGGYSKSTGDFNSTENRFTFWGVNLYGGWAANNIGIGIEGGYTGTYNALRQDVPAAMAMAQLKGDVNSQAWHAGLRAEYCFETPVLDIIPHAGIRWTGIHMDSYKVKSGGGTVYDVDDSYQNIWTFPVGISFAKTFTFESGWTFRPQIDGGVIPAAGDVKSKARVRVPGVPGNADSKVQQVDYVTFDGTAGFEVANGKGFSIGLNYNLQLSEHRTGHGVFGTLRYEF